MEIFVIRGRYYALAKPILIALVLFTLAACAAVTSLPGAMTADLGSLSRKADNIPLGSNTADIIEALGEPQKVFVNKEKGLEYMHYCLYGMVSDEDIGFWLSEGLYFERFYGFSGNYEYGNWESGLRSELGEWNCYGGLSVDWSAAPSPWNSEIYNIDLLRVTKLTKKYSPACASGGVHTIILEGSISPDSSFAMDKLLKRSPHCRNMRGEVVVATTVQLESGGGYLVDGYKLGRSLRRSGATTIIENQEGCASSCAVAFLGGKKRIVADTGAIMFHAPYFSGKNAYGEKLIDCDIPKADLQKLNAYYVEMVGKDAGDRIYERTMWYCSSEDGWVVTGGSAAELYDIATEK